MSNEILSPAARETEKIYHTLRNKTLLQVREGYSKKSEIALKMMGMHSTSIARSEMQANEDDVVSIRRKADAIRSWLIQNGDLSRVEDIATKRLEDSVWTASADLDLGESNGPYALFLSRTDINKKVNTTLIISFDNTYQLIIEFPRGADKKKTQFTYETNDKRLEEIAQNEFVIALDLLEGYLSYKNIP